MVRSVMFLLALALAAPAARAQSDMPPAAPEGADARYQFNRVEDGYLRLDLKTGQVSLCSRRAAGWSCLTVADDRAALEQEIGRLQNENVAMKKQLLARGVPLPEGIRPGEPGSAGLAGPTGPKSGGNDARPPSDAEIDRTISTVERVWRRLLEMIGRLQKDMMNRT